MSTKYKYSNIKDISQAENYNFYGIIYDASFPSTDDTPNTYVCNVKLIDTDTNCLTFPSSLNDEIVTLIIKSNTKENLPYIHNVGDIMRIHRGHYKPKKKKTVYLTLSNTSKIKASWCIFSGASDISSRDYTPIGASSNNYTFENQDKQKIDYLRSFVKIHFKEKRSLIYEKETKLKDRMNMSHDGDGALQIIHKTELEDKIVFFVQDETDGCELHTFKYFNFLEVNDVIRLRSYRSFDKNSIVMNKYSNILKIPPYTDYFKDFINRISFKMKAIEPNVEVPVFQNEIRKEDIEMNVDMVFGIIAMNEDNLYPVKRIHEITNEDNRFIIEVNILEFFPDKIYDYVSILCQRCYFSCFTKDYTTEELIDGKFFCKNCKTKEECRLYYNFSMIARENPFSNKLIKLYLSSYDNEGVNFFGMSPCDYFRNPREYEKLSLRIKKILDKDFYCSIMVEAINTSYNEYDKIYRIIGDYQNNL